MSIASEISRLSGNVSDSLAAVAAKGVTVPSGSKSDDLAELIGEIETFDCPTFTVNSNSITCDKTFAECTALFNNDCRYCRCINTTVWSSFRVGRLIRRTNSQSTEICGLFDFSGDGVASYEIIYSSNGTITGENYPVPRNDSSNLIASGATVTVPAGYYSSQATKTIDSGTEGTPTATKGTVSNHSISVTPSVTNTAGYISGSTKTGTAVTVTASELASGNKEITSNGTGIDVVGYSTVSVNVSGASAIGITDTADAAGGIIRTITAVDLSSDTITAANLAYGYTAHDAQGNAITGTLLDATGVYF